MILKQNIILSCILVFLLTGIYVKEEVLVPENRAKLKDAKSLFRPSNIIAIHVKGIEISRDTEWTYNHNNLVVDQLKVEQFLNILKDLTIAEVIETEKQDKFFDKFKNELTVVNTLGQKEIWQIGNYSSVSSIFYMKSNKHPSRVYIVKDESLYDGVYQDKKQLALNKFQRLIFIYNQFKTIFIESDLTKQLGISPVNITELSIKNSYHPMVEIDINKQQINRPIPKPLILRDLRGSIKELFSDIQIQNILEQRIQGLELIGNISYIDNNKNKVLNYYQFKQQSGKVDFVQFDGNPYFFKVKFLNVNPFLVSEQFFWDKRIAYDVDFTKLKSIDFELIKEGKIFKFSIADLDSFKVESEDNKVSFISSAHMNFLFNLILNLVDFKQASYVSPGRRVELKKSDIGVRIFGKVLAIKIDSQFIQIYDKKEDLSYFFKYDKKQINQDFFDGLLQEK